MSGTGYPWTEGEYPYAADINSAFTSGGAATGAASGAALLALTDGGPPGPDATIGFAIDATTLMLYVQTDSQWVAAGSLLPMTAAPPLASTPFGWKFGL